MLLIRYSSSSSTYPPSSAGQYTTIAIEIKSVPAAQACHLPKREAAVAAEFSIEQVTFNLAMAGSQKLPKKRGRYSGDSSQCKQRQLCKRRPQFGRRSSLTASSRFQRQKPSFHGQAVRCGKSAEPTTRTND